MVAFARSAFNGWFLVICLDYDSVFDWQRWYAGITYLRFYMCIACCVITLACFSMVATFVLVRLCVVVVSGFDFLWFDCGFAGLWFVFGACCLCCLE